MLVYRTAERPGVVLNSPLVQQKLMRETTSCEKQYRETLSLEMSMIQSTNKCQTIRASGDPEVEVGSRDVVCVKVKLWTMKGVGTDHVWGQARRR